MIATAFLPSLLRAVALTAVTAMVVLLTGTIAARPAHAAQTFTVNTTADGAQGAGTTCDAPTAGDRCTLRAAIELANKDAGDSISVPAGLYELDAKLGILPVQSSMTISGAGSAKTAVDGGGATQVLGVSGRPVSVSGLTVQNGASPDAGGGILNVGVLALTDVVVTGSSAVIGGGIATAGPVTLTRSSLIGNQASFGGGLFLDSEAPQGTAVGASVVSSTIRGNSAHETTIDGQPLPGEGGGLWLFSFGVPATVSVSGSAVTGNSATGEDALGGGVFNADSALVMVDDTLNGNTAPSGIGGGILQFQDTSSPSSTGIAAAMTAAVRRVVAAATADLNAALSRLSSRPAAPPGTISPASTSLDFVTLAGNSADELGGGVATGGGTFAAHDTIVAANAGGNCGGPGAVTSGGYNLESANDCGFGQTGDQHGTDPGLDALKLNAPGTTATMALLPGSPAIDSADPRCDQSADQRGVTRPQGSRCDIG
ncbi:MAG TPA: choice-of-anchor Q domain-containing protein, partial [Candidatus Eisenbacteria bacterium]|nr:choice-of-anchor Q domain-containing protein [Candidatus Eisenbacteria bacterium]